jgi:hypothetical protein
MSCGAVAPRIYALDMWAMAREWSMVIETHRPAAQKAQFFIDVKRGQPNRRSPADFSCNEAMPVGTSPPHYGRRARRSSAMIVICRGS